MTSSELRDYATVVAASVALLVFIVNVLSQARARRLDDMMRFNLLHQALFAPDGYLGRHLAQIEAGRMVRDRGDVSMEAKFQLMLLDIERMAILANIKAIPRATQVYMLGSYAPHILKLLTEDERRSMFWELAISYLERIARDSEQYAKLPRKERRRFWR